MRRIRNVDKTWDAVRAISPSDYHLYFFIKLDTKSEDFSQIQQNHNGWMIFR